VTIATPVIGVMRAHADDSIVPVYPGVRLPGREVVSIDLNESLQLVRDLVAREDGIHGTGRHAGIAVDALLGIDVQMFDRVVAGLVGCGVNAVDGTDLDA
jgi:hypothetical protein